MRITNNMIMGKSVMNMNANKNNISMMNDQMTTQKKISRPSDDPVIAIRALRLRSDLGDINQFKDNNIPDAEGWLEITETALNNMKTMLTDIYNQCVYGASDSLNEENRETILKEMTALAEGIYLEGNADYAGRTVFTGHKTNGPLTFMEQEEKTSYEITQKIDPTAIETKEYSYNNTKAPSHQELKDAVADGTEIKTPGQTQIQRIQLGYGNIENVNIAEPSGFDVKTMSSKELADNMYTVGENEIIINKDTGEALLGTNVVKNLEENNKKFEITYDKTGFNKGELRPEHYFDCKDKTDPDKILTYTNYDEDGNFKDQKINYAIAAGHELTVNTMAKDVFSTAIGRDINEMMAVARESIEANKTVKELKDMQKSGEYTTEEEQEKLNQWIKAAEKQRDYADAKMQRTFDDGIKKFKGYMEKTNLAITDVGTKGKQLEVTKTRIDNQHTTIEELKSSNENREISDIILDFTSAQMAYQASLQAASKVEQQTLLDYI